MKKIVLATNNRSKTAELQSAFEDLNILLIPQCDYDVPEVKETGLTFVENALIKARHAAKHTGLPALSDDSGLSVKALRGAPGLHSARFAHDTATDEENVAHLLKTLKQTLEQDRAAKFICILTLCSSAEDPAPLIAQGIWYGSIATEQKGTNGFGYDPIFLLDNGLHAAELDRKDKMTLSHRGIAIAKMRRKIQDSAA